MEIILNLKTAILQNTIVGYYKNEITVVCLYTIVLTYVVNIVDLKKHN